jgi:integrase
LEIGLENYITGVPIKEGVVPKRIKTKYPGVFYREAKRIGGKGSEKVFYIVFKKDGKVVEEKAGRQFVDDMTEARAAGIRSERIEGKRLSRKEIRELKEARKKAEAGRWTIDRLWEKYKVTRPQNKAFKTDESRYKNYLKPTFGNRKPKEIIPLDTERLRIKLQKKLSPQTVKHVLNLLTWIINYGVNNNLCDGISFKIKKPTVYNIKTEDLDADQLLNLLKAIEEDTHPQAGPIMKLALFTGLRRGEMLKLKWADIKFDLGFIFLKDPKGGPDQQVPLNDAARELLNNHPRTKSPYVFPGREGGQRVNVYHALNEIKKKANLPKDFRPLQGLRHVYASMLASSGQVDLYTLQKLLTHIPGKDEEEADTPARMDLSEALGNFFRIRNMQVALLEKAHESVWQNKGEHPEYDQYSLYILIRHILMHDHWHMYRMEELWLTKDSYLTTVE